MKKLLLFTFALFLWTGAWADGFYVVGTMNNWSLNASYKLSANPNATGEYMITGLNLSKTDQFKIVYSADDVNKSDSYYPQNDPNYGAGGEIEANGYYSVYFKPTGNVNGWYHGCFYVDKENHEYTVNFTNSIGWNRVYAYTFGDETLGVWPGTEMTKGVSGYSLTFNNVTSSNIIFNNGLNSGEVGISKTDNLVFVDNMVADLPALATSGSDSKEVTAGENTENNGKTLSYTWEYTQTGQDVTLTFAVTNDGGITGLVNGSIRDRSNDGITYHEGLSYTWENCTPGQIIKADHHWACALGDIYSDLYSYVVKDNTTPIEDITSITVTAAEDYVEKDNTTQLTVKDMNSVTIAANNITFESDNTNVATVNDNGLVTAVAVGTATITAKLTSKPGVKNTVVITVTGPFVAPTEKATPQPNVDDDVLVVHSSTYGISLNENDPGWGAAPKPVYGALEKVTIDETQVVHVTRTADGVGVGMPGRLKNKNNVTTAWSIDYYKVRASVYPNKATKCRVYDDDNNYVEYEGTLIPNKWNYIEIEVSSFNTTKNYMTVYLTDATECYIDHFYFAKVGEGEMAVNVVDNTATVIGTVDASKVATLVSEAGTAAVIDFSGATINEDITINPQNINALVVVYGDARTPNESGAHVSTESGNNIVVYNGTYRRLKTGVGLLIQDDNASQPSYNFVIDASGDSNGFSYKRTIGADKWVSFNSPASVTIPDGVDVYKATGATTTSVTFTKQGNKNLGANDPVILHNTTGSPIDIISNNIKSDLNLTANPGGAAVNGTSVIQYGTARAISTDGSQFALSNGELHPFNGGTIGAFRVYYTGLSASSGKASAVFVDENETTHIGSINANGEINVENGAVYNLAGQRVAHPTKGLYIVNGKKVIIK